MRLKTFILTTGAMALTLASCTEVEDHSDWGYGTEPNFTAYVSGGSSIGKADSWPTGISAGVFMKAAGSKLSEASSCNREYQLSDRGKMTSANTNTTIHFPIDGSKVDFVAYAPYNASATTGTFTVSLTDQQDQSKLYLIQSANATNCSGLNTDLKLGFENKLAKVFVVATTDNGVTLNNMSATLTNAAVEGTYNLGKGNFTSVSKTADITMPVTGNRAEATVIPMSTTNSKIAVAINGMTKEFLIYKEAFLAGKTYVLPVKVTASDITTDTIVSGVWTENPGTTVATPTPNTDVQFEKGTVLFEENFGTAALKKVDGRWPLVSSFTAWSNPTLTFKDVNNTLSLRNHSNTNVIWFPSGKDSDFSISGFDTQGYKKLILTYELNANLYNAGDQMDLAAMTGTFNGQAFATPSQIVKNPDDKNTFTSFSIELPITSASANSELHFLSSANANTKGLRLAKIKFVGIK
ncbi:fimbrillin family protein [Alloprevotella rava]|uniref:Uncharacterized protein n=2 Tax=Alloprevotella rava TaxID=671218 RepID=G5GC14_9BACT|nr:fimbrillin family protein [Alloprevotella rava]EHG22910.1 hypothetical protein HMPREF9332_01115 [Alloprevotella rava F0323]MBB3702160.1 hypothetical protein [Alloprevotella rava]